MATTIEVRNIVTGTVTTSGNFIEGEIPAGTKDGVNTIFTIVNTPISSSTKIYLNGQRLTLTDDYTISSSTITFISPPISTDTILADYRY